MPADLATRTDAQLMDAWTPPIFLPRNTPRLRADALRENARIEAELRRRGIHRS